MLEKTNPIQSQFLLGARGCRPPFESGTPTGAVPGGGGGYRIGECVFLIGCV